MKIISKKQQGIYIDEQKHFSNIEFWSKYKGNYKTSSTNIDDE